MHSTGKVRSRMGLYLDSASLEDARKAQQLGYIEGITTNPWLIAQTGRPGLEILSDLVDIFDGHIFYQLTAGTAEARTDEAWRAYEIRPDKVILKVPTTTENLSMVSRLVPAGIECAMTSVYSPTQAYLGALVRASYVIPHIGRLTQHTSSAFSLVHDMVQVVERHPKTEVLAASFGSITDVLETIKAGVQHLSLPLELILALGEHDLSHQDIADVAADIS